VELEEQSAFLFGEGVIESEFPEELIRRADGHDFEDPFFAGAFDAGFDEIATDSATLVAVIDGEALDFTEFSGVDFDGGEANDFGFSLFEDFGYEAVCHEQD